jgi:hypothetical protein
LEDYILAHGPAPDDGLSDEERLIEWHWRQSELDADVTYRTFTGEGWDDGTNTEDLRKARDEEREALEREERRQHARFIFGMRDKPPETFD